VGDERATASFPAKFLAKRDFVRTAFCTRHNVFHDPNELELGLE
jgi:hypothetical protein